MPSGTGPELANLRVEAANKRRRASLPMGGVRPARPLARLLISGKTVVASGSLLGKLQFSRAEPQPVRSSKKIVEKKDVMKYEGLSSAEVERSRAEHGSNSLTPPARTPLWRLFLEKFTDPVIRILLIAAFLSLGIAVVQDEYYETIGIFCAIFLATGVSFWFEVDAARKFDILNQVNDDSPVRVVRDGQVREVGKRDIVVGDIILLETGDEIPADVELVESVALKVKESNLNGDPSA